MGKHRGSSGYSRELTQWRKDWWSQGSILPLTTHCHLTSVFSCSKVSVGAQLNKTFDILA